MNKKSKLNIDKLVLSFKFNTELIDTITRTENYENNYITIKRICNSNFNHFKYVFELFYKCTSVAYIYFCSYNPFLNKIYFQIKNNILYQNDLNFIYDIINTLKLEYDGIHKLELAFDMNFNCINKFYQLLKNTDYNIIILNKKYEIESLDIIPLLHVSSGTRKNNYLNRSIYIQNKEKGLVMNMYNKLAEIQTINPEKEYIIDCDKFKSIFRNEIRVNSTQLNDSLTSIGFTSLYLLQCIIHNSTDELLQLYNHLLNRLIHFTLKNQTYSLLELLNN